MSTAQLGLPAWSTRSADETAVQKLVHALGCPQAIAQILVSRAISDTAAAQTFFTPTLDDLLDPMLMLGMETAVARIQRAVRSSEPILIYGDYDVDGTTATVLLKTAIERIAPKETPATVTYHVPHRIREGYGMQNGVLGQAAASGVRLVISVDTGIRAFAAAEEAKALGMDLIVTDHHLPDGAIGIPDAVAVLNPAQQNCPYPFKHLCGAAVAFKLAHALLLAATETEEQRTKLKRGLIPSFLKLVAIATIADSVPSKAKTGSSRLLASKNFVTLYSLASAHSCKWRRSPSIAPHRHRSRLSTRPTHQRSRTHGHRRRCRRALPHQRCSPRHPSCREAQPPQRRAPRYRSKGSRSHRNSTRRPA
ncbi:DHH family phosphoesterase [Tunturiibacter gelidiferens]|uniref:DHH family phosphoesterase n=1 Tax=Tunturiibacter gelidiferens TaxID=3069689 RepID=UPI003D9B0167